MALSPPGDRDETQASRCDTRGYAATRAMAAYPPSTARARPGPEQPGRAVDRDGRLGGEAGHVLPPAGRQELADGDERQGGGGARGVPDDATETDADDGGQAHCPGPKTMACTTPGWPMATWACWLAKIRWPSSKPTTLQSRVTRNANAATVAALAASTRWRAGRG